MIGEKIRELREANNVLLRQLAAQLDMDTALLSKMERGDRAFRKEDLVKIGSIFKVSERELLIAWLADKVLKVVDNESYKKESLKLVMKII
ncbi:helix-turn-helix domain-containing protein [Sphingobacterium lumbrici]|uniref:helix-turn-helix domain-containing protein n=1 Tax=Sphingobacterium lumbrici TaxID=2559600 RepID=UPI00112D3F21|nr:helix-turn-helix transcriptional regulator [Sphingobacterium lumbrici]